MTKEFIEYFGILIGTVYKNLFEINLVYKTIREDENSRYEAYSKVLVHFST